MTHLSSPEQTATAAAQDAGIVAEHEEFLRRFPAFSTTITIDELRRREYARLDRAGHTYLDYTGASLYAESQVREHHALLQAAVLGNPHSENPTSLASTALVRQAREDVRRFFNADPDEYEVIFTPNARGALRLVGESYAFAPGVRLLLTFDNHNSVNGLREFAHARGARTTYVPVRNPDLRVDVALLLEELQRPETRELGSASPGLFAYPAQSNFSGVQHPLAWIEAAHDQGWDVVLDCAAYVPTNTLDLRKIHPDFVCVSFYKMFGYPTGIGALIARRSALARLRRPWFAGGTITVASVQREGWHHLAPPPAGFEDGTVDFLGLPAVSIGLRHLEAVGMHTIHTRVICLAGWLLETLAALRHSTGAPLVHIFGPRGMEQRGATIALQLLDPHGRPYDVYDVEAEAGRHLISVRTGCFCNPGDGEVAHQISDSDMAHCFRDDTAITSLRQCQIAIQDATGKVPNTLRVSLGLVSTFADAQRFVRFAASYCNRGAAG